MTDTRDIVERPESPFNRPPLAERIAQAKAHMAGYRQHNEALWTHQSFALTVGELLEAAERGLKAADEIKQLRADLATSMETAAKRIAALSETVNQRAALAQPAAVSADAEDWLRERFGVVRGHPEWRALAEAFDAGKALAQPAAPQWQQPGPVTAEHPLECLIVVKAVRQSDGDWWIGGSTFLPDDTPIAWVPHTAANRAALEPKP